MDTIVVASPNAPLVSSLAAARPKRPRRVVPAASTDELERALTEAKPACVVVDARIDAAWELVRRVKVDGQNGECRTPVVLLESETAAPFLIVPDERVKPPHDPTQLSAVLDAVIERRAAARRLFTQEIQIEMATTPDSIEKAADIFDVLVAAAGFDDHDQVALATTFREAVGNAAEHGNKHDARRKIRILYLRDAVRIAFVVTDEGPGFDHTKFLARAEEVSALEHTRSRRASEARPGGLGVFIMKKTCDLITFNDSGNSIYLMKFLPGRGGKSPALASS